MPPTSTDATQPATEPRVEVVQRRIREGYYARPEVRRTLAELLRLSLLRRGRAGKSRATKSS